AGAPALRASERIFGLDVARGLALLGMFVAHTVVGGDEKLVDGRSSILFATVAGVSLGLLTGGSSPPASRRGELRIAIAIRGLLLVIVGVLLTLLEPPLAGILAAYGVAFLVLVPALFLPRTVLLAVAFVGTVAAPPIVAAIVEAVPLASIPLTVQPFAVWFTHGT